MENRYVFVLLRVKYRNEGYRMLHTGVRFNMTTIHLYLRLIIAYVESRNNHYRDDVIEEICFKFFIIPKREEKEFAHRDVTLLLRELISLKDAVSVKLEDTVMNLPLDRRYNEMGYRKLRS